jgi:hypothetical protein
LLRNQIYSENYKSQLNDYEERSKSTSVNLNELSQLYAKTVEVSNQNGATSKSHENGDSKKEEETRKTEETKPDNSLATETNPETKN